MNDARLLADFAASRSPAAFAEVVRRHVGLVHAAAMRQVRDADLADDIAQSVFILLARKAHDFRGEINLPVWLLRATRYAALDAVKLRHRRRFYESRGAAMRSPIIEAGEASTAAEHGELLGLLDEGLLKLPRADRELILLRFYQQRTFHDVGARLGIDAEAARKRVGRAVERLRAFFVKRGGITTAIAVAGLLTTQFAKQLHAAPPPSAGAPSLAARISRRAVEVRTDRLADSIARRLLRQHLARWSVGLAALVLIGVASLPAFCTALSQSWPAGRRAAMIDSVKTRLNDNLHRRE